MPHASSHRVDPVDRLWTLVGEVELANPILCASGTWGSGREASTFLEGELPGALVTKTVTLRPRAGNPPPRLVETSGGLLNSIGLMNPGIDAFLAENLPSVLALGAPVVLNLGGESLDEFRALADRLTACGATALEVNLSCPNVQEGRLPFASSPEVVEAVVAAVRERVAEPVWAKLSPNVTDPGLIARAAVAGGASALVCSNTLLGMAVDWRRRAPRIPLGVAGYSGPPVKPVALRIVWQVAQAVAEPVIGVGGICSAEDVCEFLVAGASAVQVGTASLLRPDAMLRILRELRGLLAAEDATVRGLSRSLLRGA